MEISVDITRIYIYIYIYISLQVARIISMSPSGFSVVLSDNGKIARNMSQGIKDMKYRTNLSEQLFICKLFCED
jgi:hypothetical protein